MFEKLIENRLRLVSFIGANVVDDTEDFTIPVSLPPPPEEGSVEIVSIDAPDEFTPGVSIQVNITIKNVGGADTCFVGLKNKDTGEVIAERTKYLASGETYPWGVGFAIYQETDFHGRVEAGHEE